MSEGCLDLIRKHGDAVERHIFADDDFANSLSSYPIVWNRYVFGAREAGSLTVSGDWRLFAQHHYASIVRCWSMYEARTKSVGVARTFDGEAHTVLELQGGLLAFYGSMGSALDNLEKCFTNAPAHGGRQWDTKSIGDLRALFDRRNAEVHDGIRPIFGFEGMPVVDKSLYGDRYVPWEEGSQNLEELEVWIESEWNVFVQSARAVWSDLLTHLHAGANPSTTTSALRGSDDDSPPGMSHAVSGQPDI